MPYIALGNQSPYWKEAVADVASLPASGGVTGEVRLVLDVDDLYEWNGSSWEAISGGGGSGDVVGPASSTDNAIVRFDSTTGKLVQNSGVTVSDGNVISTTGALVSGLTASRAVQTDASKNLESSAVTTTELGYVSGVSSAIQTQLGNKQALDATLTALAAYNTNGILTQTAADTFAGRTITGTASEITVTNGDGVSGNPTLSLPTGIDAAKIGAGGVSSTEFGYLDGVTSAIQTQMDAKAPLASPTFTTVVNLAATAPLRLQDTSGGEYVGIKAPGTVTTYTLTMPAAVPGANQALVDAGAGDGVMAWATAGGASVATPSATGTITSYVDVIRSGVTTITNADTTGTETDGFETYIFSTGNTARVFTTPAVAVSAGRTIRLVKSDTGTGKVSVTLADGTLYGAANATTLWAQGASTSFYCDGANWFVLVAGVSQSSTATTWVADGSGGTSASKTIYYQRVGDYVTFGFGFAGNLLVTSGTGTISYAASTAVASFARPLTGNIAAGYVGIVDNGNGLAAPGYLRLATSGIFTLFRDSAGTAFTNSASMGFNQPSTVTLYVGTGS